MGHQLCHHCRCRWPRKKTVLTAVLTTIFTMFSSEFCWLTQCLFTLCSTHDAIQNGRRDLEKYPVTLNINLSFPVLTALPPGTLGDPPGVPHIIERDIYTYEGDAAYSNINITCVAPQLGVNDTVQVKNGRMNDKT